MHTQLTIFVESKDKILLEALALLIQQALPVVVGRALHAFLDTLSPDDQRAVRQIVERSMHRIPKDNAPGMVSYPFRRLCFKKSVIDSLGPNDVFRVDTPQGSFAMTKADFVRDFPNVSGSPSYQQAGLYHYPKVPRKAERYRCAPGEAEGPEEGEQDCGADERGGE